MSKESNLVKQIKAGNQAPIEQIYLEYKREFLLYAVSFSMGEEEALDIFQDSIIVLYENIVSGKLTTFTCSVKTYLFAIGKYKIYSSLRKKSKMATKEFSEYEFLWKEEQPVVNLQQENIQKMQLAIQRLGDRCKTILKLFYYQNYTIDEIKHQLDYASKEVVKSQKSRCLKRLRELIDTKNKE